ncbi:T9SS type A sorting domain-containing protein [Flavobacterium rakeshii]|uniref:T9SS type A sorting domain-containing protein n=1 Tax=Flavobacterium rakeshii TaxID=1038845 RepID=A0A6N8HGN5_9FLAO|nr:T9SS type A sorting domain-containing protein [Flavobacterium rakeshii]MUV04909.1 T9SS type A sorting domain-containing protein [Flavobacterium rakeshii]
MKSLYTTIATLLLCISGYSQTLQNGGFETGNYTGYSFTVQNGGFQVTQCNANTNGYSTLTPSTTNNNFNSNATLVTGSGNDATLAAQNIFVPIVNSGNFSLKLNNNSGGGTIATMSQNFLTTSSVISFDFSLIVEDLHQSQPAIQPFFTVRAYNLNDEIISNNNLCITADPTNPIFSIIEGTEIEYTGWKCGRITIPDEYVGQEIRLEFVMSDCGLSAHLGTVYIDNITNDASCNNPVYGFLQLNPVEYNCPNQSFNVCGNYILPENCNTPPSLTLEITQNGNIVSTLTNAQTNGNTFCFNVNLNDFGANPNGDYEFNLIGDFTLNNNNGGYILTLFDSSSVPGADVNFGINPEDATVNGSILSWPDTSTGYTLEFVADGTCCPDMPAPISPISYTVTTTDNQFDLDIVVSELSYKCFRWRILSEDCGSWSDWCCLAVAPGNTYENLLDDCYPNGLEFCLPSYHAVITENGISFEQREQWITAENTIQNQAEVTYQAGDYLELQPGFNTVTGAVFLAQIEGCVPELTVTTTASRTAYYEEEKESDESQIRESFNGFTVYPNPTNGSITVKFENSVNQFGIYDVTGKQLISIPNTTNHETQIDLSNLAPGIYFLTADGAPIQKIVKN